MRKYLLMSMIVCMFAILTANASATLTPATLFTTLRPGSSVTEDKVVYLSGIIPKGDVMFAFDLTGSMWSSIDAAEASAINIMGNISKVITDVQFGVISFMDYPASYTSYGYSATYGYAGIDYPYGMNQSLTSNMTQVSNVIHNLGRGYGADAPEAYARVIFESYSDTSIGWRTGARHILIILGDSVPHYENLNEGIVGNSSLPGWPGNYSTGGDPGRDGIMFTPDDIYLPTALQAMAANQITLLYVKCHSGAFPSDVANMMYWTYWTGITGGAAYSISDASMIPTAIEALVTGAAAHVNKLTLQVQEPSYTSWLTSVSPKEYDNIIVPAEGINETFTIVITVPSGTSGGTYTFHITALADGADYGEQTVTIFVPTSVIPETPVGSILAVVSLITGLLAYVSIRRFRNPKEPLNL
jgi:hypothetical protein